ncbi:hypothetical protein AV545_03455 [Paenibacillus jamilae]|nr:hypothetical protein AV545_03455 [Paenibacillus jamilae]
MHRCILNLLHLILLINYEPLVMSITIKNMKVYSVTGNNVRISTEEQTCKIIWRDHRLKLLTNDDATKYLIMIFRQFLRDILSKTIMATNRQKNIIYNSRKKLSFQ